MPEPKFEGSMTSEASERDDPPRFNEYVLKAISKIAKERAGGGYDIKKAFSQDLSYGRDCCIRASQPPLTMCVAAVAEVIIEALNIYFADSGDDSPFKKLPMSSWNRATKRDIRPYIFMFKEVSSKGTAHALERFGIGAQTNFLSLKPGDFVNFNRVSGSGHAAVFLGYLDRLGNSPPPKTRRPRRRIRSWGAIEPPEPR